MCYILQALNFHQSPLPKPPRYPPFLLKCHKRTATHALWLLLFLLQLPAKCIYLLWGGISGYRNHRVGWPGHPFWSNLALFWRVWACLDVHQIWRSCIGLENNSETASKSKTKLGTKWWCSFKSTARGLIHEQRWLTGCQPRAAILQGPLLQIARYESWASQEDCHCMHWEVVF